MPVQRVEQSSTPGQIQVLSGVRRANIPEFDDVELRFDSWSMSLSYVNLESGSCHFNTAFYQNSSASGENWPNDFPVDVGQPKVAALMAIGQSCVVDPQQMQNCGIQVVNVYGITNDIVRIIVRFSVHHS
jgi:hypothetical protein